MPVRHERPSVAGNEGRRLPGTATFCPYGLTNTRDTNPKPALTHTHTLHRRAAKSWPVTARTIAPAIFAPPTTDGSIGDSGE